MLGTHCARGPPCPRHRGVWGGAGAGQDRTGGLVLLLLLLPLLLLLLLLRLLLLLLLLLRCQKMHRLMTNNAMTIVISV